jgi:hypothetical protein
MGAVHFSTDSRTPSAARGIANSQTDGCRNVLHADVLAFAYDQEIYGIYYERVHQRDDRSLVFGVLAARDARMDSDNVDARELRADLVATGIGWRSYRDSPEGFYVAVGGSLVAGKVTGEDDRERTREYWYIGYDVSILGLGYQLFLGDRVALDVSTSFRQALGYLTEAGAGNDDGFTGGYGIIVAGGVGWAF